MYSVVFPFDNQDAVPGLCSLFLALSSPKINSSCFCAHGLLCGHPSSSQLKPRGLLQWFSVTLTSPHYPLRRAGLKFFDPDEYLNNPV